MKGISRARLALAAVLLSPMAASATLVDFEDLAAGDVITNQYADDGVIFDSGGLSVWNYQSSLQVCPSDVTTCIGDLRFHFVDPSDGTTPASTDSLSFQIGDEGGDLDEWDIHIFDLNFVKLEERHVSSTAFTTQVFNYADIGSVWIEWAAPHNLGYLLDNLEFKAPISVPEPGTLSLLGVSLLGFGMMRRRRRTA